MHTKHNYFKHYNKQLYLAKCNYNSNIYPVRRKQENAYYRLYL